MKVTLYAEIDGELYKLVPVKKKAKIKAVHNCEFCTGPFVPGRKDKRYCSGKCRAAASRARREA